MSNQAASFNSEVSMGEERLQDPAQPKPERKPRVVITGGSGK